MKPPTVKRRPLRTSQALVYDDHGASDVYGSAVLAALQREQQSNSGTRRSPRSVRRRDRGNDARLAENCRVYGIRRPSSSSRGGGAAGAKRGGVGVGAPDSNGRAKPGGDSSRSRSQQSQLSVVATVTPTTMVGTEADAGSVRSLTGRSATGKLPIRRRCKLRKGVGRCRARRGAETETASNQLNLCRSVRKQMRRFCWICSHLKYRSLSTSVSSVSAQFSCSSLSIHSYCSLLVLELISRAKRNFCEEFHYHKY
jgi:hypothetical protein